MKVVSCDICGTPLVSSSNRFAVVYNGLRVEIVTQRMGKWSNGSFCWGCILQAVFNGEFVEPSWFARKEMIEK